MSFKNPMMQELTTREVVLGLNLLSLRSSKRGMHDPLDSPSRDLHVGNLRVDLFMMAGSVPKWVQKPPGPLLQIFSRGSFFVCSSPRT